MIKKLNPEMTDELLAYSVAKMKEYGIVDSGDTLKDGIGAMTDARVASFFDKMVRAGVVTRRYRLPQGLHAALHQQGRRPRSAAEELRTRRDGRSRSVRSDTARSAAASRSACAASPRSTTTASRRWGRSISKCARGEFVSLLGPSGCGKSTALRLIAGLSAPTSGTVEVAHRGGEARGGHSIGFVFQEPTLMPWASVRDNVRLPLEAGAHARGAKPTRASMSALAQVGLAEFADAYPRELSGGMKMRVSLARALVTDPDILLMDEPFAALDEITRFRLNNDLLALWRDLRKTVIFVTHSVFESVYLSQRVIVMTARPGRIAAEFRIDAPEPRGEEFRTSAEYAGYCRDVSQALAPLHQGQPVDERADAALRTSRHQPACARCCGSCCRSSCWRRASRSGSSSCASTTSRPMCCRDRRRCSRRWSTTGRCCRARCWRRC